MKLNPKEEIKKIHDYCKSHDGICLENKYKGTHKKYKCICKNNHEFDLIWCNAKNRKDWCAECAGNRLNPEEEIKKIHDYCKSHDGICLENKYKGTHKKHKCKCKNNHEFNLIWCYTKKINNWCLTCVKNEIKLKKEMDFIHKYCKRKKGICLETFYKGINEKYKCKCKNDHIFYLVWNNDKSIKDWCKDCSRKKINPEEEIKKIHEYCKSKNGICLENEYKGSKYIYNFICERGHNLKISWSKIKSRGDWCRRCKMMDKIDPNEIYKIYEYCKQHDGECLEDTYKGIKYKYKCKCKDNHIFNLSWISAKRVNSWCPICAGVRVNHEEEIKKIHEYCENNNGICLENEYKKSKYNYKCKCQNNHIFYLNWDKGKRRGDWCKKCNDNIFENTIKEILKEITNKEFIKIRPDWLKNPETNRNLELDCYNKELNLAIECQGPQHYKIIKTYGMTKEDLKYQQYKDNFKRIKCKEKNITLIEIKYKLNITKEEIKKILIKKLNLQRGDL